MAKKPIPQEPYRRATAQYYTVEVFCHKGLRQPAPVKRITNCLVHSERTAVGLSVTARDTRKKNWDDVVGQLVLADLQLGMDGLWVHGVEGFDQAKTFYQVWFLRPEPNEFSPHEQEKGN